MKATEIGTQVVFQIPAQKGVWGPIVDSAQDFCKKAGLYCGICIGWKELWTFGKESTVFMTIATTTHPATAANKTQLAEVAKKVTELVAFAT
jgi:hypothetical protein